jgi:nitroreductase
VAGGQAALAIRNGLVQAYQAGEKEAPDIAMPAQFSGAMMDRYRDLGRSLFKVLGIGREDNDKRSAHYANNYNAFGAPVLVYVTVPAGQTTYAAYDAGAFVANFCLAAADAGLGTCIAAALARYPRVVREHLPIADDESLVIGVSLGWPEAGAQVNAFRSARDPLDKVLVMKGME